MNCCFTRATSAAVTPLVFILSISASSAFSACMCVAPGARVAYAVCKDKSRRRSVPEPAFSAMPLSTSARYRRAFFPELKIASSISRAG